MEELSGFTVLISRNVIITLELEAVVDVLGRQRQTAYESVELLGRGVLRSVGRVGGLTIRSESGEDVTEQARATWNGGPAAFDAWREEGERRLDRAVLQGPTAAEEPALRAGGWNPMVGREIAQQRARQEREQADRFASIPHFRKQRVRDAVSARHVAFEINEPFFEALSARGLELEDIAGKPESARRFVDSMPSSDVAVSLTAAAHRNPQTRWTANRIFYIDALAVAVPYCDLVVTDREASHALHAEGVPERLGTEVMATLSDLAGHL
jgi:hypothetical protein